MTEERCYQELRQRIDFLRRKENGIDTVKGIIRWLGFTVASWIAGAVFELFFMPDSSGRWTWIILNSGLLLFLLIRDVLRPFLRWLNLLSSYDERSLAQAVGSYYPEIRDRLVNALLLGKVMTTGSAYTSVQLAGAFIRQVHAQTAGIDFQKAARWDRIKPSLHFSMAVFMVFLLLLMLFPQSLPESLHRLWNPHLKTTLPPAFSMQVQPGNAVVIDGQSLQITVGIQPLIQGLKVPHRISVFTRLAGTDLFREEMIRSDSNGIFVFQMNALKQNLEYYIVAKDKMLGKTYETRSELYEVVVRKRPSVKHFRVKLRYPEYTGLGERELDENSGDLTTIKGTRVHWRLEASKPLRSAEIVMQDQSVIPLTINSLSSQESEGNYIPERTTVYTFRLTDTAGIVSADPVEYTLRLITDETPMVRLLEPDKDTDINESMLLPLIGDIQDDFGFSQLTLRFKLDETKGFIKPDDQYRTLDLSSLLIPGLTQMSFRHNWNLMPLNLIPEDVVSFYLEVADNDAISGPKFARSVVRRLRFPSLAEMFADANQKQDRVLDKTSDIIKAADEVKKEIENLNQSLLKNKQLDWKEQEKAKQLIEKQQQIQKDLQEVRQQLEQLSRQLEEQKLISKETLEKYQEVQKLLSEVYNKDFQEMMQKLQQAMKQNLDQRRMMEVMKQLRIDQNTLKQNLDRTAELLKRIKAEQMFDQLNKEMEDLLRRQEMINAENAANPDKTKREALAKEQERIESAFNRLSEKSEQLKSLVREIDRKYKTEQLDEVIRRMKSGSMQQRMQQSAQSMSRQSSASREERENQELLKKEMQSLSEQMKKARDEFRIQQDRQIMAAMRKIVVDLLELSVRQEELIKETRESPVYGERFISVLQKQGELRDGLNHVIDQLMTLSNQTFFVTSTLGKTVGKAMGQMNESLRMLEDRSTGVAALYQNQSMVAINDAVKLLMQSMDRMRQGQSGTGLQQMMDDLQKMAGQQGKINDGTMPFAQGQGMDGNTGQMSLEEQAALSRLMAEQQALRDALEQMSGTLQGQESLKGQLDRITKDMDEVLRDMAGNKVNRETIRRQQQILQRMLDASRSMQEREYSEKRKGETAKEYKTASPRELLDDLTERKNRLRREWLKSRGEGYAKDYEELIRLYFEALGDFEKRNAKDQ